MEKTKIGITVGLMGGALYFIGMMGLTPLVIAAAYVFLKEENAWLKRTAVKAVAVVLFFAILSNLVSLLGDSSSILDHIARLFDGSIDLATLNRIVSLLHRIVSFISTACLLLLGFSALKMGDVKMGGIDKAIDK